MDNLLQKYNVSIPRYTSYPPVPFWQETPTPSQWFEHVKSHDNTIDIYIHVPYCESLCYYCGCNRTITKDHNVENIFLDAVKKEWLLYKKNLHPKNKIKSMHLGGGTPTFLSPSHLKELIEFIVPERDSDFIGSIEIDPRTCKGEHLEVLSESQFKRVSLGIQDFDPDVQKAIHRFQTPEQIAELVKNIRHYNIESINFDLIYGLPKQTVQSIETTMNIVLELKPDLISFYSYAHLPDKIKNQKLIAESDLPSAQIKHQLFTLGAKILQAHGYEHIGMDHFALPGNYLYLAKIQNQLKRTFMGYTDKKSAILIGLGPTAISDSSLSFAQNIKEPKNYIEAINDGKLPIEVGHIQNEKDQITQEIIQQIMCQKKITIQSWEMIPHSAIIQKELTQLAEDNIISYHQNTIEVTELGTSFLRNIAVLFDYRLREKKIQVNFSKSI